MIRTVLLSLGIACAILPACASTRSQASGTTTTTSGTVNGPSATPDRPSDGMCGVTYTLCTTDDDCCSVWCVAGQCEPRAK